VSHQGHRECFAQALLTGIPGSVSQAIHYRLPNSKAFYLQSYT
jgi:hypothetical protein